MILDLTFFFSFILFVNELSLSRVLRCKKKFYSCLGRFYASKLYRQRQKSRYLPMYLSQQYFSLSKMYRAFKTRQKACSYYRVLVFTVCPTDRDEFPLSSYVPSLSNAFSVQYVQSL